MALLFMRENAKRKKTGILRLLSIIFYLELLISCNYKLQSLHIKCSNFYIICSHFYINCSHFYIIFYLELLISCNHSLINANIHYPLIMIWNILHKVLSSRHANILLFYFISWPSILVELPPSEMCSLAGYLCPDGWCCWPKPTSTLIMRSSS